MATFYRCDRCHQEQREPLSVATVPRIGIDGTITRDDNAGYELCGRCVRELREWIKPQPKVMAATNEPF